MVPENSPAIKAPPPLIEKLTEKGNVDGNAKKNDGKLYSVQKQLTKSTAALMNASD